MSVRAALELAGAPDVAPARRLRLLVVDDDAVDRLAVRRAVRAPCGGLVHGSPGER